MAGQVVVKVNARVNWRRLDQMTREALAKIRRARKRDRGAMYDRAVRDITAACVKLTVDGKEATL